MPERGFNILVFGEPGRHLSEVVRELKRLDRGRLRLASNVTAFELKLKEVPTHCVVLCLDSEMETNEALVERLHQLLGDAQTPTVVVLQNPLSGSAVDGDLPASQVLSRFDVVIGGSVDRSVLEQSVDLAVTLSGGESPALSQSQDLPPAVSHDSATRELPTVGGDYPPPVGNAGGPAETGESDDDDLGDSALQVRSWGGPPPPSDAADLDKPAQAGPSEPETGSRSGDLNRTIEIDGHIIDPRAVLEAALRDADAGIDPKTVGRHGDQDTSKSPTISDTGTKIEVRRWDDDDAPPEASEAAESGADNESERELIDDESDGPPLESTLPPLHEGPLSKHAPWRVLLAHEIAESTGVLQFENGGITRELALLDGVPGSDHLIDFDERDRRRLMGALLWSEGRYSFKARPVNRARFRSLGSVLELVHAAMINGLTVNQSSMQLTEHFRSYVAITERTRDQWDVLGKMPGIWDLLTSLSVGPLEQVIANAGAGFEPALKNLVFCQEMDLIAFSDTPRGERVPVRYRKAERTRAGPLPPPTPISKTAESAAPASTEAGASSRGGRAARSRDVDERVRDKEAETTVPESSSSVGGSRPAQRTAPKRARPAPPVPDEDPSDRVIEELAGIVEAWNGQSAYEVFGLWEGCGAEAVSKRYYELVRLHHPDTYGLARSPQVQPLAEMVFRAIQKAFTELRREERGDASRPAPIGAVAGPADEDSSELGVSSLGDAIQAGAGDSSLGRQPGARQPGGRHPGQSSPGRASNDVSSPGSSSRRDARESSSPGFRDSGNTPTEPITRPGATLRDTSSPGHHVSTRTGVSAVVGETGSQPGVSDPASLSSRGLPQETAGNTAVVGDPSGTPPPGDTGDGPAVGAPLSDSDPNQPSLRHRGIMDSATRLRTLAARMASGGHPVANIPPEALEAYKQQQKLPPEQHFRNGVNMIKVGAYERAIEALELGLEGRPSSAIAQAHLAWARFRFDSRTAAEQKKLLEELLREPTAEELACLFLGHILMAEGDEEAGLDYYKRCLTLNSRNVEAQRRMRLYRMRHPLKKGGLFDRIFSRKPSKKKSPKSG